MSESSEEDDPVEECVRRLQNNDEYLVHVCLARIIPEVYEDGELDEDGDEIDYEAKNVDDEVVRIASALANNTVVQGLYFEAVMRDTVSRRGALAIGQALAINRSVTTLELREENLGGHQNLCLILEYIAKNPSSTIKELTISVNEYAQPEESSTYIVEALSILLTAKGFQLHQLILEGLHVCDGAGMLLSEGLKSQPCIKIFEVERGNYNACLVSPWAAFALCNAVPTKVKMKIRVRLPTTEFECTAIRKIFSSGKEIQNLDLESTWSAETWEMTDAAVEILAEAFRTNNSVQSLQVTLRDNNSVPSFDSLIPAMMKTGNISSLSLRSCNIGLSGAKLIRDALKNDNSLICLELSDCNIGDAGVEYLSHGMKANTKLKELKIDGDKVGYEGMWHLSLVIAETQALESFHIETERERRAIYVGVPEDWESPNNRCDRLRLETDTLSRLLASNSPLKQFVYGQCIPRSMPPIGLSCFKTILNGLKTNFRMSHVSLPLKSGHIVSAKDEISDLLQKNCHLKRFHLLNAGREDKFSDGQQTELKAMMMNVLQQNHTLTSVWGLLDCGDDSDIKRMLDLNEKGVLAAAALKGEPLPDSYVENLPDVALPTALAKIGSEAGVGGVYSFLKQIHAATVISSTHSASSTVSAGKKRTRQNNQ